jgi:hypothetical protein
MIPTLKVPSGRAAWSPTKRRQKQLKIGLWYILKNSDLKDENMKKYLLSHISEIPTTNSISFFLICSSLSIFEIFSLYKCTIYMILYRRPIPKEPNITAIIILSPLGSYLEHLITVMVSFCVEYWHVEN